MAPNELQPDQPLRLGAVAYLNTAPLVHGLQELLPGAILSFDHPSRLADKLADAELDVALAPCIELARHPQWTIVSDACIGCRGPVLSVKVLFRTSPARVRSLALDEGSRTSAVLAQILLASRGGARPQLELLPIGASPTDSKADAVLVIGDRAIAPTPSGFVEAWDLGAEWVRMTGLPFVFAAWMSRPGVDASVVERALEKARDAGVQNLETIAAQRSAAMNLPREVVLGYLRDNLNFKLEVRERRGLDLYFGRAAELGLIPQDFQVRFDDCRAER